MINKFKIDINPHYLFILLSIIIHLFASYSSIGFYAMDEHYQILEPLAQKLNLRDVHIYEIWELGNGLRPWTQVYIFYFIIQILKYFSIYDPFVWIFIIKILLSLLGLFSTYLFYKLLIEKNLIKQTYFNSYIFFFFWFLIFFHARTSSENLSMSIFIIGLITFFKLEKFNYKNLPLFLITGSLFGLSILIRYQIIFILIPLFFWLWIYHLNFVRVFFLGMIIIFLLIIGLVVDYFGYGNFINTYYNYYYFNLVVGIFDGFGIEPWWYYVSELVVKFSPPIGLFFLVGMILFWINNYSNFITWITLPYFLIFTYLGHKELRFIFPLFVFLPFFIIYLFSILEKYQFFKFILVLKILFILINTLFCVSFIVPVERQVALQRFISQNLLDSNNLYYFKKNPYLIDGLNPYFYTHYLPKIEEFNLEKNYKKLTQKDLKYHLITNDYLFYKEHLTRDNACKKIYSSYPEKIILLNNNWKKRDLNWFILGCG